MGSKIPHHLRACIFQKAYYLLYNEPQQFQQIPMLNPPAFSLNNRASARKPCSKEEVKKAYTLATPIKKPSKSKHDEKVVNKSISKPQKELKNIISSVFKTPKKEKDKINPEKSTSKKQEKYKDSRFQQMKVSKNNVFGSGTVKKGLDRCQTEGERLQMLKQYLKEDTEKIKRIKLISDQHVIAQMSLTQENLKKKLEVGHQEHSLLLENHRLEVQALQNYHNSAVKQHQEQMKAINKELDEERKKNMQLEAELKQCHSIIQVLKKKLEPNKEPIRQSFSRNDAMESQVVRKVYKLETEVTELESKVATFACLKKQLEQEIARHRREKQEIKKQSEEVLDFLRSQYSKYDALPF